MLHATLVDLPMDTDSAQDPGLLLEREDRAAMALLRLVAAAALAIGVLGLALRLLS
ncbi:hypothetical protein [Aquabacterium sp.]|uniref:hypothetical protein n=1 Tax=Aquabacterium sp. TaxID=1872578 RepID=UPI002CD82C10|nr:hypothetical protein [Aquabacterium sp.]HSW06587.1 hypothetical protein [Aquabacterium sp.]